VLRRRLERAPSLEDVRELFKKSIGSCKPHEFGAKYKKAGMKPAF
jgi:hypothetical protein